MKIIGITGSFKTGKSSVLDLFKSLGAKVFDTDKLANKHLKEQDVISSIKNHFKDYEGVVENNSVNRKRLAEIVFSHRQELDWLNALIHPLVKKDIKDIIKKEKDSGYTGLLIFEVPLLYEADLANLFDKVLAISASRQNEIKRAVKEGFTENDALMRINAQLDLSKKEESADYIVNNNGSLEDAEKQLKEIIKKIKKEKD
jgi:dephospho-CoA kinase